MFCEWQIRVLTDRGLGLRVLATSPGMTKERSAPSIHTRPTLPYPARSVPREGSSLCTGHRMGDRGAGWAVSESAVWCWAVHPGPECGSPRLPKNPPPLPSMEGPAGDSRGKVFTRVYRSMRAAAGRRPEGRLLTLELSVPLWPPPSLVCRGARVSRINGQTDEQSGRGGDDLFPDDAVEGAAVDPPFSPCGRRWMRRFAEPEQTDEGW